MSLFEANPEILWLVTNVFQLHGETFRAIAIFSRRIVFNDLSHCRCSGDNSIATPNVAFFMILPCVNCVVGFQSRAFYR
ncbi:hypothetical protein HGG75_27650 [Ochrobactrum pseudogrignonense]|nr:hypothetical protein [Brucella pseudogrignonensis]